MEEEKKIQISFTEKELVVISEFLSRTDLKGKEVKAYVDINNKLQLAFQEFDKKEVKK